MSDSVKTPQRPERVAGLSVSKAVSANWSMES